MVISPKCPKCDFNLRISRIQGEKWICKKCNEIFDTREIKIKGTWYERLSRYRAIEQIAGKER